MKKIFSCLSAALLFVAAYAQEQDNHIYDESRVPDFVLPDPLVCNDGSRVTTVEQWEGKRRAEVMEYFFTQEYGRTRGEKIDVRYELLTENKKALGGKATQRQVKFIFSNGSKEMEAVALMYFPNKRKDGKCPVFVGYNFKGNHSTTADADIVYTPNFSLVNTPFDADMARACQDFRWPFERVIDRGYAVVTMCYHDIYPDAGGRKMLDNSILSLFPDYGQDYEWSDGWRAIGAWAWGSSRIVDYLETQDWVDTDKIAIMGHSRQGKAALWAGAQDPRFKVVISNDSGCGGAALSKRVFGEDVETITRAFPHWFCSAFKMYAGNEAAMPFDQHELIALIAPRYVYVASAAEDKWADQKGEFLSAAYAEPVFNLYGMKGLGTTVYPAIEQPIMNDVGYHVRNGEHNVKDYDWDCFMDFCDKHFGKPAK